MLTWLAEEPFWVGLWVVSTMFVSANYMMTTHGGVRTEQNCEGWPNRSTATIVYLRQQHLRLSGLQTRNGPCS